LTLRVPRPVLVTLAVLLAAPAVCLLGCGEPETEVEQIQRLAERGDVDALAEKADSPDPEVSRLAVRALVRAGKKAQPAIRRAMHSKRPEVREEAALIYPRVAARRDEAQEPLTELLRTDPNAKVRASAVTALGHMTAYEQMEALFDALDDPDGMVRQRAAKAVARIMGRKYELFINGPPEKRRQAIEGLRGDWRNEKDAISRYYERRFKQGLE